MEQLDDNPNIFRSADKPEGRGQDDKKDTWGLVRHRKTGPISDKNLKRFLTALVGFLSRYTKKNPFYCGLELESGPSGGLISLMTYVRIIHPQQFVL